MIISIFIHVKISKVQKSLLFLRPSFNLLRTLRLSNRLQITTYLSLVYPTQQKLNNYIQSGSLLAAYSCTLGVTTNSLLRVLCVMRCDGAYVQPFTQLRRVWFKNIHLHLIYPYVLVPILDMYVCRSRYSLSLITVL